MKKIKIIIILLLGFFTNVNAETKRITIGNLEAKITIIAYESLTCSHCANFHIDIYPQLKKERLSPLFEPLHFINLPRSRGSTQIDAVDHIQIFLAVIPPSQRLPPSTRSLSPDRTVFRKPS